MSQPIFLLVTGPGFTEAWHQLSEAEQNSLWSKVEEADKRAGAEWVVRCDARWANEAWGGFAVIKYPDMDRYLAKVAELEALNWWRYFSCTTTLGLSNLEPEGDG